MQTIPTKQYSAMLYALAKEMRDEEGCVTESDQLVEQAAERLDSQTVEITVLKKQNDELLSALEKMNRAYVGLMENGRDRIIMLGGDCDPIDVMERSDPNLRESHAAIASAKGGDFDVFRDSCPNYTGIREDHDSDQCTHGKGMDWCEKSDCPRLRLTDASAKGGAQ